MSDKNLETPNINNEEVTAETSSTQDEGFIVVELSDKRKVKVDELTGLDEMIAAKMIGNEMNTPGAGMLQYRMILVAFAIKEIDGKIVQRPKDLNDVRAFMAKFKMKDTSKLQKAFSELNDAGEN